MDASSARKNLQNIPKNYLYINSMPKRHQKTKMTNTHYRYIIVSNRPINPKE